MIRYRKKPVVIEAMQWDGSIESMRAICEWANDPGNGDDPNVDYLTTAAFDDAARVVDPYCHTLEGTLTISPEDWVIRGVQGEFYPCKPDIFEATYEAVNDA